ncbi:MAG: TIGR04133 family radical SAM/SPASM protein [Bacteroidales bacterium]
MKQGVDHLSLRKKAALALYRTYRSNEASLHNLNYIFWECTLRCNLNCRHCGSDCTRETGVPDMPGRDFLRALDEVRDLVDPHETMVVFTGEALLRTDLEEVGRALYDRGFPWGVVTNGMLLDKARLDSLLAAGMRALTLSLDGLEDTHNRFRGSARSFGRSARALEWLAGVPDLTWDVVTCVHPGNFHELEALKEFLIERGTPAWRMFTVFPIGRAQMNTDLQLPPAEFRALFDFIRATRAEGRIRARYGCEGFLGSYEMEVRDDFFHCRAGINVASVLCDGSISACPNLRANYIQGNIHRDNFREVWETRFQRHRDRSWTRTGICAQCKHYKDCQGNGLHLRDEKTGELLFCHLQRLREGENEAVSTKDKE